MSHSIYLLFIYLMSSKFTISVVYLKEFTCLHNFNNIPTIHPHSCPYIHFKIPYTINYASKSTYLIQSLVSISSHLTMFFFCLSLLPCLFLSTHSSLNYDIGIHTAYPSSLPNLLQLTRYFSFFFPPFSILLTLCSPANSYGTGQPACLPTGLSVSLPACHLLYSQCGGVLCFGWRPSVSLLKGRRVNQKKEKMRGLGRLRVCVLEFDHQGYSF